MKALRGSRKIPFALALLASALACRAATRFIHPDTPVPQRPPSAEPSIPANTPPAATDVPTVDPAAACPNLPAEVIRAEEYGSGSDAPVTRGDNETILATYPVSGDQLGDPTFSHLSRKFKKGQQDTGVQHEIWTRFAELIPRDQRTMITEYDPMTDGQGNLLAAVTQTDADPNQWLLEVDIADSNDTLNLAYTLIHEFGHLVTLNVSQVPPDVRVFENPDDSRISDQAVAKCPQYFPGEGCSKPDSYINTFYNQFWSGIYTEWKKIDRIENEDVYFEKLDHFYSKYQDQFINDYAVSNPPEDIAESWSYFVLAPKPAGDTIAGQKILFFYHYPELVQVRAEILNNLCASFSK